MNPETPFEALRYLVNMTTRDWAKACECSQTLIVDVERGRRLPNIPLAKRMQEEALRCGIAITLDEMFQNVLSWKVELPPCPTVEAVEAVEAGAGWAIENEFVKRCSVDVYQINNDDKMSKDEDDDEEDVDDEVQLHRCNAYEEEHEDEEE